MKFPSHLNCDGKIVSEMGPWPYTVGGMCAFAFHVIDYPSYMDTEEFDKYIHNRKMDIHVIHIQCQKTSLHMWLKYQEFYIAL